MAQILRQEPRTIKITPNINPYAAGSVLIECGNTKVHVTANVAEEVPRWLKGKGKGWVTAEYSMLPGSTHKRIKRERKGISGRSQEIQRLIARSLRAGIDLKILGEQMITVDCDVLVADGGTRTTSITGGFVALQLAINSLLESGQLKQNPITHQVAAISIGINKDGDIISDLNYEEDSSCETDMNIVMTKAGAFIEVQGTAEGQPFSSEQFGMLIDCAKESLKTTFAAQDKILS